MTDEVQVVGVSNEEVVETPVIVREVVTTPPEQTLAVETVETRAVEIDRAQVVIEQAPDITVITVGEVGPRGSDGIAGSGTNTITRVAAVALGGHRAVVLDSSEQAIYADRSIASHIYRVLGVTTGAASQGADATIQTFGEMNDPSFNWTLSAEVFLSTNGQLTQAVPTAGFIRVIGFPLSATKLFIDLSTPVVLA